MAELATGHVNASSTGISTLREVLCRRKSKFAKISEDLTIQERATNQSTSEGGIKTNLKVEEKTKRKNWQQQLNWVSSDIYGNQC